MSNFSIRETIWYKRKNYNSCDFSTGGIYSNICRYYFIDCKIPSFGPFLLKVVSIPVFYSLNALGWVVSTIAIKKGYVNELSKNRTVTFALLVGIIIKYILGNIVLLDK